MHKRGSEKCPAAESFEAEQDRYNYNGNRKTRISWTYAKQRRWVGVKGRSGLGILNATEADKNQKELLGEQSKRAH